eukprot:CAMPEP_0184309688 /NCGR_PEP_ID=MMETSP1049-20130417/17753_1 /TAXON_ID=77928 /ORGANISM="Proteomonas sulcata, Strain CCMP704" /LENGTH=68 /DNA_ID=CAMNT_0026622595 /DNA_START=520 /DNA_END=727 /DNA_ORIENTATION=-
MRQNVVAAAILAATWVASSPAVRDTLSGGQNEERTLMPVPDRERDAEKTGQGGDETKKTGGGAFSQGS